MSRIRGRPAEADAEAKPDGPLLKEARTWIRGFVSKEGHHLTVFVQAPNQVTFQIQPNDTYFYFSPTHKFIREKFNQEKPDWNLDQIITLLF